MVSTSVGEIMGWSLTLKTSLFHATSRIAPKIPMNQKQLCQPWFCVSQPKIGAKTTSAKYCEALKIAEAVPRSAVGNQAATTRPLPGKMGDCARPEKSRTMKMPTNTRPMGK